jgi:hypothetical protein
MHMYPHQQHTHRRKQLGRIVSENERLLKRIIQTPSMYNRKNWLQHEDRHYKLRDNLKKRSELTRVTRSGCVVGVCV